jgi:hypothetical protein
MAGPGPTEIGRVACDERSVTQLRTIDNDAEVPVITIDGKTLHTNLRPAATSPAPCLRPAIFVV